MERNSLNSAIKEVLINSTIGILLTFTIIGGMYLLFWMVV